MAGSSLFTETQLARIRVLYVDEGRPPTEVASILNAEYEAQGLKVMPRQITECANHRGWGKAKRSKNITQLANAASVLATTVATLVRSDPATREQHKDFIESAMRTGAKAMQKAEAIIDKTSTARDLSSAINAAAKGAELYSKGAGIGDKPVIPGATTVHNYFNFARAPGSPFCKRAQPDTEAAGPDARNLLRSEDVRAPSSPTAIHASSEP